MPSWHPPDSESGMVQDDESTIQVHNDADACFFRIPLDYIRRRQLRHWCHRVIETLLNNVHAAGYIILPTPISVAFTLSRQWTPFLTDRNVINAWIVVAKMYTATVTLDVWNSRCTTNRFVYNLLIRNSSLGCMGLMPLSMRQSLRSMVFLPAWCYKKSLVF